MEFLKALYADNKVKTALWTIVNALIVIVIVATSGLNAVWVAPMVAALNFVTKHINQTYLS